MPRIARFLRLELCDTLRVKSSVSRWITVGWMLVQVTFAILFVLWCVLHLRSLDRVFGFGLPYVPKTPGSLLVALGSGLVLWCAGILANVGIFESAGNRTFPREFVAMGPFRYIGNPTSFGATALFVGLGCGCAPFQSYYFQRFYF
jgi:hypothetical protein